MLVETQRLYYVYRRTSKDDAFGVQDVVEMDLYAGENVLGARLIDQGLVRDDGSGNPILMLLTQYRLLTHELRP